MATRMK